MKRFLSIIVLLATLPAGVFAADISTAGWRLWPDREAAWKDDTLYLPAEVKLDQMPVNPPTGGWQMLSDDQGVAVTLPSTVEEHFWGKFGIRPYAHNEAQRGPGTSFGNGNYLGVSWWWREIQVPKFKAGQRVIVSIRGARLRSEVYCNDKLCGYSIMTELPFQADLTDAVKPGQKAQLAIRITNPGGHLDWIDFGSSRFTWGKYTFPPSRGFGGLDDDIQLDVRDDVSVTDLATINKPDLHQIHLVAEVTSKTKAYRGAVKFQITHAGQAVWQTNCPVKIAAGEVKTVELDAQVDSAEPWNLQTPNLYEAHAALKGLKASSRSVPFGFRFFTAEGIGQHDAKFTLNGKRAVLVSSISWGFWGRNGLWPDQEMAEREVADAKAMGLNCLQFHRNIGKPAVLDIQDREGLLRYEEPGAGKFAMGDRYARGNFGPDGEYLNAGDDNDDLNPKKDYVQPDSVDTSGQGPEGDGVVFWEKYEEEKIMEMVKRDRSHPSLIMYSLQNESSDIDLHNPRVYRIFRRIHELDPSRIITMFSGGVPKDQVLMLPYSDEIRYGSKAIPYAGWQDLHTCGGPCNYLDNLYTDPLHFKQRQASEDHNTINIWGETLGAATPDDYDKLVHSFDADHPTGYELADMTKILNGYHQFLDQWGFRQAFPTDSSLFQAIGYRTYFFWQRIVEQSRIDNANDGVVISGWESTTIDNHSGLVDNHRYFKGDPKIIAAATKPEVLVIQPRHVIVATGETNLVDLFLINEVNRTGPQTLRLTVRRPNGSVAATTEKTVEAKGGDTYGQLLAEAIEIPAVDTAGMLTLEAILTPLNGPVSTLKNTGQVEVIDVAGAPIFQNVAVLERGEEVSQTLRDLFHVTPTRFSVSAATNHFDAIVLASKFNRQDLDNADSLKNPSEISRKVFKAALDSVHDDGTRLVLWPDNNRAAEAFAKELGKLNVVTYSGNVGNLNAPWFGSWNFVRKHWLLDGLPVDCAMDWRYGVSAFNGPEWLQEKPNGSVTDGYLINAPGMETFVGFGADHNPNVGVAGCLIPYGKGMIVFYSLPQLVTSLQPGNYAIHPTVARRLLGNALRPGPGGKEN